MGCAINIQVIKDTMKRPVAPAIGLVSQYLCMPLVSYGIGYVLFPSSPELWLGLFLTGCAPGGGGSNMWTYLLGGSLDLSITMTFLSTVFAFATLPLWVLALGPSIFTDGYFGKLPYRNMAMLVFGLVIPCCIGLGIRRTCPKAADFLKKMLKPLSIAFIVFVMTFGVYTKFYLFSFFTWKVAFAGFCLPFFGFAFGGTAALLLKRNWEEVVAISIETGVQNTGLAIGVIKVRRRGVNHLGRGRELTI
ncbi:UNVERIFIED_CONTAM: hypothetical protein GTU68_057159 [Idotea baltica]|nr:hypothetical protein [Idotea baltica]